MHEPWQLIAVVAGVPLVMVVSILVFARVRGSHERSILHSCCIASVALSVMGGMALFFASATAGSDITVTVMNDTPWPVDVSAINVLHTEIAPGETREFREWADLGLSGLIDELLIYGGPDGRTRIYIEGITSDEDPFIRLMWGEGTP